MSSHRRCRVTDDVESPTIAPHNWQCACCSAVRIPLVATTTATTINTSTTGTTNITDATHTTNTNTYVNAHGRLFCIKMSVEVV
jgi:hypothetical protein